ncbi:hypothetical protein [Mycetocola saprophilus]|uniref:hypothetical protein n=1 Tax=Mycetocola saprophilus TaxID=76636 RepID=UPI003BF3F89A
MSKLFPLSLAEPNGTTAWAWCAPVLIATLTVAIAWAAPTPRERVHTAIPDANRRLAGPILAILRWLTWPALVILPGWMFHLSESLSQTITIALTWGAVATVFLFAGIRRHGRWWRIFTAPVIMLGIIAGLTWDTASRVADIFHAPMPLGGFAILGVALVAILALRARRTRTHALRTSLRRFPLTR